MNFKGLSSSCFGHSALMQLRSPYYVVSNQVSMQQGSKIVENFPPKYQSIILRQLAVGQKKN